MTFQTMQKDEDNRYKNSSEELQNEICSIWLGMRDSNPRSWDQNPVPYRLANPQRTLQLYQRRGLFTRDGGQSKLLVNFGWNKALMWA